MRRMRTALAIGLAATTLLGACGDDEAECRERYKQDQRSLTGATPSDAQAREACDRDSNRVRGGGSGAGK